jgi:hypothetical protein
LCAKALDLPPAEGQAVRAELIALVARVDALSAVLRQSSSLPADVPPPRLPPD